MRPHFTASVFAVLAVSPVIGSFLGVVIERWPAGRPFLWTHSECDACRHLLGPFDLIPFLSWALAAGRCRYCQARLSVFYPLIEAGAVAVTICAAVATTGWRFAISCALGWVLLVFAIIDWRKQKRLVVPVLLAAAWLVWLCFILERAPALTIHVPPWRCSRDRGNSIHSLEDVWAAIRRETRLKKWNREWKINLIQQTNHEWDDCYEKLLAEW